MVYDIRTYQVTTKEFKMKKLLALLLAMIMVFSLCACADGGKDKDDETEATGESGGINKPGIVLPGEKPEGGETDDDAPIAQIPFKNATADLVLNYGVEYPCTLKFDLEKMTLLFTSTLSETQTGILAIDSEGMYVLTEENGKVIESHSEKFADRYNDAFANLGLPEISDEQLAKIGTTIESLIDMLSGKKDFDMAVIADLMKEFGLDKQLADLYAGMGITEEQFEKAIQSVIDLLNDEQWLKSSFNINNTIVNGSGSFSMNADLGKVAFDVVAAIAKELGQEVPSFEQAGIPSLPVSFALQLSDNIPTKLDASIEVEGQKVELNVTNKILDNGIDLDAKLNLMGVTAELTIDCLVTDTTLDFDAAVTAMGQSFGIAVDGKIDGASFALTADLNAMGQTMRILEVTGTVSDSALSVNFSAGPEGDKLTFTLNAEMADGKPSKITFEGEVSGDKISVTADLYDYDNTSFDISDIKDKATAGTAGVDA